MLSSPPLKLQVELLPGPDTANTQLPLRCLAQFTFIPKESKWQRVCTHAEKSLLPAQLLHLTQAQVSSGHHNLVSTLIMGSQESLSHKTTLLVCCPPTYILSLVKLNIQPSCCFSFQKSQSLKGMHFMFDATTVWNELMKMFKSQSVIQYGF